MQTVFLVAALTAARAAWIDIFTPGDVGGVAVVAAVAMLVLAFAASCLIWRSTPDEQRRRLLISRPHEYDELGWWIVVSLAAGVVEEIVYRGVLPCHVLVRATGTLYLAMAFHFLYDVFAGVQSIRAARELADARNG